MTSLGGERGAYDSGDDASMGATDNEEEGGDSGDTSSSFCIKFGMTSGVRLVFITGE